MFPKPDFHPIVFEEIYMKEKNENVIKIYLSFSFFFIDSFKRNLKLYSKKFRKTTPKIATSKLLSQPFSQIIKEGFNSLLFVMYSKEIPLT